MANHLLPSLTSNYSDFVTQLSDRFNDLAVGLDPTATTAENLPLKSIKWNQDTLRWERLYASGWDVLASTYGISISGNAGTVTNGVYTTGSYSNPSWITGLAGTKVSGDIAGNAGSATKLATPRNINGVAFDGTAAISINLNNSVTFNSSGTGAASGTSYSGASGVTISYNTVGAPSTSGVNATGSWGISITGNAATSTTTTNIAISNDTTSTATVYPVWVTGTSSGTGLKISSSRMSFTPSTGNLSIEGTITTPGLALTGVAGGGGVFNGTGDGASNTIANIQVKSWFGVGFAPSISGQAVPQNENAVWIDVRTGSIGARGDIYTAASVYANSDETLKTNWRALPENFVSHLAKVKSGIYDRLDRTETQAGVGAQSLQALLPQVVHTNEAGILSVTYGNAAMVSAIELAKEIELLKQEVKQLKEALNG